MLKQILSGNSLLLPPLAYLAGIIIQCLILLREKPKKSSIAVFIGMFIYMIFMMFFAIMQTGIPEENQAQVIISQIMTYGLVFTFLFIAIFLKSVVRIIDEVLIVSNTVSFWFLLSVSWRIFGIPVSLLLSIIGAAASIYTVRTIFHRKEMRNTDAYFFYGWYLLTNGLFAVGYFNNLSIDFHRLPAAVNEGVIPPYTMLLIGMTAVHVAFNFGILYYSFIYSLFSAETRSKLADYTGTLFRQTRGPAAQIKKLIIIQTVLFILSRIFASEASYVLYSVWILLTPVLSRIMRSYNLKGAD